VSRRIADEAPARFVTAVQLQTPIAPSDLLSDDAPLTRIHGRLGESLGMVPAHATIP
jgi:hypothetical protein